jgi:hypothetical protein
VATIDELYDLIHRGVAATNKETAQPVVEEFLHKFIETFEVWTAVEIGALVVNLVMLIQTKEDAEEAVHRVLHALELAAIQAKFLGENPGAVNLCLKSSSTPLPRRSCLP